MKKVAASELKNRLGTYIDAALAEPVIVEKSGRSSVVILSMQEYERLIDLEDAYWAQKALKAETSGWVSDGKIKALVEQAKRV